MNNTFDPKNCRYSSDYIVEARKTNGSKEDLEVIERWALSQIDRIEKIADYDTSYKDMKSYVDPIIYRLKKEKSKYSNVEHQKKIDKIISWFSGF